MLGSWDRQGALAYLQGGSSAKQPQVGPGPPQRTNSGTGGDIAGTSAGTRLTGSDRAWECCGLDFASTGRRREDGFDDRSFGRPGRTVDG